MILLPTDLLIVPLLLAFFISALYFCSRSEPLEVNIQIQVYEGAYTDIWLMYKPSDRKTYRTLTWSIIRELLEDKGWKIDPEMRGISFPFQINAVRISEKELYISTHLTKSYLEFHMDEKKISLTQAGLKRLREKRESVAPKPY